jgi:hypothetical protein
VGESEAEVASVRDTLKKNGYSEKAIEEVLKWYGSSPRQRTPQKQKG